MNWFQRLCLPPEFQSANRPHLALPASVAGEFAFTNKFIAYGFLAEDREQTAFDLSALKTRHSQTARQKG